MATRNDAGNERKAQVDMHSRRHNRTLWRTLVLTLASSMLLVAPAAAYAAPSAGNPVDVTPALPFPVPPTPPEFDAAFYRPAAQLVQATTPGGIIAARQVNLGTFSVVPLNVDAWQVSYRSNNHLGQPIAATATVIKPRGATPDGGPRHLVSFQMAEDSLAQYCSPSYALQLGSVPSPVTGAVTVGAEFLAMQASLIQGWAVVVPDHQGPESAYAAGPLAGRITLDGIRAAENFAPLGLDGPRTKVGMTGYSGGAIATGWAAELHKTYAPELNVVGTAEGGVPVDLGALVNLAENGLGAGTVLGGVIGLSREYPELAQYIDQHATPAGRAVLASKQNLCVGYTSALVPFLSNKSLIAGTVDPLEDPVVKDVLEQTTMGHTTPDMPMFIYQSNPDWLVPVGPVNGLVDTYCRDPKASVTYTKDNFSEHLTLEPIGLPAVVLWMHDRFAGMPATPGCTRHDVGSMALNSATWPVWTHLIGEELAGLIGKPIGS